jgi:capsular polysaccharide biosynthesis protein
MELKDFVSQLLRNWFFILVFVFLGLVVAFFFNQNQKEAFRASLLLYLKPATVAESQERGSTDNYYSQLRVKEFSDSLIAFLLQPEVQREVGRKFQIKKLTPQILRLIVEEEKAEQAKTSVLEAEGAIRSETKKFEENEKGFFQTETLTLSPSLEKIDPHKTLNLIVGLLLGFVFGILAVSTKIYFYPKQN